MKTPILGQAYVARSVNAADNRLVNLFPEVIPEGGKEAAFFSRCPGLTTLATLGVGPVRGLHKYGIYMYAVSGQVLYKLDEFWNVTTIGAVLGSGTVSMADNGDVMFIACGSFSYQYQESTLSFSQITSADFLGATTVGYMDGYFVFNVPNSQQIQIVSSVTSAGASIYPLVFDATEVSSAEGSPDNILSLIMDHREVWLFGMTSIEVWYDAGTPDFPFQRIQGAVLEIGCAAASSVAKMDNSLFWLGADDRGAGIVYRANGYNGQRISTHAVEFAIQGYSDISDAIAYTYQQEGHAFYVLSFPTGNATWVYDVATNAWHERAYFETSTDSFSRHRSNCHIYFSGENVVGDYENGKIYAFDLDVYQDGDDVQKWLRSWRALPQGQTNFNRVSNHALKLDCQAGVGLGGTSTGVTRTIVEALPGQDSVRFEYHTFQVNDSVRFAETTPILGLVDETVYYVAAVSAARTFTATITTGSTTISSPSAFISTDRYSVISADGVTPGTIVSAYQGASTAVMSAAATDAMTASVTFTPYKVALSDSPGGSAINILANGTGTLQLVTVSDPQIMLRWSDDGGHTWSNEHWASMGEQGQTGKRVIWRRLGMTQKLRDRVYEISGTDPVKIAIMGAELVVSPTNA